MNSSYSAPIRNDDTGIEQWNRSIAPTESDINECAWQKLIWDIKQRTKSKIIVLLLYDYFDLLVIWLKIMQKSYRFKGRLRYYTNNKNNQNNNASNGLYTQIRTNYFHKQFLSLFLCCCQKFFLKHIWLTWFFLFVNILIWITTHNCCALTINTQ